jgi:hypothetical protein
VLTGRRSKCRAGGGDPLAFTGGHVLDEHDPDTTVMSITVTGHRTAP